MGNATLGSATVAEDDTVTVSFTVKIGDVWIDPNKTAWYVRRLDADDVTLERTVMDRVSHRDLARKWRKMGEPA